MTKRINRYLGRLADFVAKWDGGEVEPEGAAAILESASGNLNRLGSTEDHTADTLTPTHPQFKECLEPGIRDLVCRLVFDWSLITYSSCGGHQYLEPHFAVDPRHIGILPRSEREMRLVQDAMKPTTDRVNGARPESAVCVRLVEFILDADDGPRPCLELRFDPVSGEKLTQYFDDVDYIYADFLAGLPKEFLVEERAS
jgi:uncharacterized protein